MLPNNVNIPSQLVANIAGWNQAEIAPDWLAEVPGVIGELCAKWRIELEREIPATYMTLVLLGHSAELGPVVIKASPLFEEFPAEAAALRLGAGENVTRLYDVDLARGVMVMERIVPGTQLREVELSDAAATRLAAETVMTFQRPVSGPTALHPLRRWMRALFEETPAPERVPTDLLTDARTIAGDLLARSTQTVLLHGDFQHHNLLRRESGDWAIIDPKGIAGDPGFEIAAWMYNPPGVTARDDYATLAARRLAIFAEVWGIDRAELAAWAFAGSVLSAVWSAGDPAPDVWVVAMAGGAQVLRTLLD